MNQDSLPRSSYAVPTIIFLNIAVFLLWTFLPETWLQFMLDHFLISWTSLSEGRYWTLLTAAFSHNLFWHFLLNMFVLNSFGPIIEEILGFKRFVLFYLAAAIFSSFSHAVVSAWIIHQPDIPALGASGAISGIILLFSLLFPKQKILIFGLIPVPAFIGAFLFIGLDVWGLTAQAQGGGLPIGHGAHLGGALAGVIFYLFYFRPKQIKAEKWYEA